MFDINLLNEFASYSSYRQSKYGHYVTGNDDLERIWSDLYNGQDCKRFSLKQNLRLLQLKQILPCGQNVKLWSTFDCPTQRPVRRFWEGCKHSVAINSENYLTKWEIFNFQEDHAGWNNSEYLSFISHKTRKLYLLWCINYSYVRNSWCYLRGPKVWCCLNNLNLIVTVNIHIYNVYIHYCTFKEVFKTLDCNFDIIRMSLAFWRICVIRTNQMPI
jgi:hypothetical protein